MVSLVIFDDFFIARGNGVHNMGSDSFNLMFSNVAPDKAVDTVVADITEIAAGGGYPSGGLVFPVYDWSQVAGLATWKTTSVTFTPSGDVDPFQYIVAYNATAVGGPLVGYYDRGTPVTLTASGDPFVIYFTLDPIVLREKQVVVF